MGEQDLPVVRLHEQGQVPRAYVFTGKTERILTPVEAKRARFIQNLKENYTRLKEALSFVERFAVVCELSQPRIEAIRKAKDDALDELSRLFEEKLKSYDDRIKRGG